MLVKFSVMDILEQELVQKCSACAHYTNCSLRLGSSKLIIQCEYFEDKSDVVPVQQETDSIEGLISKGLCSNCAKVKTCGLPKCFSGVWHCEEYE